MWERSEALDALLAEVPDGAQKILRATRYFRPYFTHFFEPPKAHHPGTVQSHFFGRSGRNPQPREQARDTLCEVGLGSRLILGVDEVEGPCD